jgi:hypothetical protein
MKDGIGSGVIDVVRDANPVDPNQLRADLAEAELRARMRRSIELAAIGDGARELAPAHPRHTKRVFVVAAGGACAVLAASLVLALAPGGPRSPEHVRGPVEAAAAMAAAQPFDGPGAGQSAYQRSRIWQRAIPGARAAGEGRSPGGARTAVHEVWLTATGGGVTHDQAAPGAAPCSARDVAMEKIIDGGDTCEFFSLGSSEFPVIDPGTLPKDVGRPGTPLAPPGVSELGGRVDDLPSKASRLRAAIGRVARTVLGQRFGEIARTPEILKAARFEAIGEVLANPLARPDVRSLLFRLAGEIPGVRVSQGVSDPLGRSGTALSLTERYEGTEVERRIVFDPRTSRVLATTASLLATHNRLLAPWLERVRAPELVSYRAFGQTRIVNRDRTPELFNRRGAAPPPR